MRRPESLFGLAPGVFDGARIYTDSSVADDPHDAAIASAAPEGVQEGPEHGQTEEDAEASRLSKWTCGTCGMKFVAGEDQRAHFKSDFHRLNVKRKLAGKPCFSEEEFENFAGGNTERDWDVSSVSGSESEIEEEDKSYKQVGSKQITIQLGSGSIVQVWRCLLLNAREKLENEGIDKPVSEVELFTRLKALIASPKVLWVVLLAVGGHFAGVVVDIKTGTVQAHQTYHRYVVRAKAGGRQTTRDATGRAPKSAGASLRRYNELALQKEIKKLLESWSTHLQEASCIFIFAPSGNSKSLFGESPLLDRSDIRVRQIPFATRRPTYKEARRVYGVLSSVTYMEKDDTLVEAPADKIPSKKNFQELKEVPLKKKAQDVDKEPVDEASEIDPTEVLTPLHEAAMTGNTSLVTKLLEEGSDPCIKRRGRTPYAAATDKETRNAFRKFMASHPDKWDWHTANVPSALTDEMEAAQAAKQAEKNAKRRAKEKERKKERKAQQKAAESSKASATPSPQEAAEIAKATQRELRAAAAESRLKASHLIPVNRDSAELCSCCASSLANKVPFYKYSYKYCSVDCVNAHRRIIEEE